MMMGRSHLIVAVLLCGLVPQTVFAQDAALHQRIDELIHAAEIGPVAEPADDATFLRRVSLDLIGRIPTRDEVKAYLGDDSPGKRQRVIEKLLASPDYPRHMADVFDLMLMERRGGKHVKSEDFRKYLEGAFAENRSYLDLVREILSADGTDEKNRAAAAFYLEREVEPHVLTRDVGRIFFGIDLQCAQCHNHPLIDDYHQPDYYGLHAFFVRSNLFQVDKKKAALIAEQATGEADFKSVFTDREGIMGPRVPGGEELVSITLKSTEQYHVAPAKDVRPIPTRSRREQLARAIAESPTPAFARNIVNRLWSHMFGRGLVHPVDLHHSANPPTHPEVLDLLAKSFAESNYDVKWLLRELALTGVYQRSFWLPPLDSSIADANQRIESARQIAQSCWQQSYAADEKLEALLDKLDAAAAEADPYREAETSANKKVDEALKARDAAQVKVTAREKEVAGRESESDLLNQSVEKTRAAAEALSKDQELAAALATIEKRAAVHVDALGKLQEALKTEQQALSDAEAALQSASVAADEAIAARVPYEQAVRDLRAEIFAARDVAQGLRTKANLAERDVTYLETLLSCDQGRKRIAELQNAISQGEQTVAAKSTAMTEARQAEQVAVAARDKAKAVLTAQQKQLETAQSALAALQQTESQLSESIASAEAAQKSLSEQEPVAEAITLLQESLQGIETKVADAAGFLEKERTVLNGLQKSLDEAENQWKSATQSLVALQEEADALNKSLSENREALTSTEADLSTTWDELVRQSSARGNAASMTALSPEQFAWSLLTATGHYQRQRTSEAATLNKKQPLAADADGAAIAAREREIDEATRGALAGTISRFAKLYGAEAGQPQQEFFATAEQSLFIANGSEIRGWLQPVGENLSQRLLDCEDDQQLARELYLSVLCRPPTADEVEDVKDYLASRAEQKKEAVQELAWGLLTSVEFRFRY